MFGKSALHMAIQNHNLPMLKYLAKLQNGRLLGLAEESGLAPLHYACQLDEYTPHFAFVSELLWSGADINQVDVKGNPPIMNAINANNAPLVLFLCQHPSINVTIVNLDDETPILNILHVINNGLPTGPTLAKAINHLLVNLHISFDTYVGDGRRYLEEVLQMTNLADHLPSLLGWTAKSLVNVSHNQLLRLLNAADQANHVGWFCEALLTLYKLHKRSALLSAPTRRSMSKLMRFKHFLKTILRLNNVWSPVLIRIARIHDALADPMFVHTHSVQMTRKFVNLILMTDNNRQELIDHSGRRQDL